MLFKRPSAGFILTSPDRADDPPCRSSLSMRENVANAKNFKPADAGDFGLETIDGAADNADQAAARIRSTIEALRTLPFFGGEKLVWLKNANFLGDDQKARSAAVQAALEELTETI